jgi:[acyl-carrier-protein] S-malonyltransferase
MNIAVVFPGQGSQSIGMLDGYAVDWPVVSETFAQASAVLGYDLWEVVSKGPEERLNQTQITQPAMLAADIAIMRVMQEQCMTKPFAFAGHSLGEYAALVAGGAIEFTDAIRARWRQSSACTTKRCAQPVLRPRKHAAKWSKQ